MVKDLYVTNKEKGWTVVHIEYKKKEYLILQSKSQYN